MRQPPSPLLLSARKRRPRRTPPRGARALITEAPQSEPLPEASAAASSADTERCALVQPFPDTSADAPSETQGDPQPDTPDRSSQR